ncbi:Hypothetical protein AA314_03022 [Archangium gephyra]|uniref:Uncharacterized protein n=1 Tax=Archangium gephyra TaxID=48 RepID=A0AAC8TE99_9BACT|nr:Hypothetical protein AA314_03022 [Archangium gephyra]
MGLMEAPVGHAPEISQQGAQHALTVALARWHGSGGRFGFRLGSPHACPPAPRRALRG